MLAGLSFRPPLLLDPGKEVMPLLKALHRGATAATEGQGARPGRLYLTASDSSLELRVAAAVEAGEWLERLQNAALVLLATTVQSGLEDFSTWFEFEL